MKTFKVAGFYLAGQNNAQEIRLLDGLIINREDEKQSWLIELFVDPCYEELLRSYEKQKDELKVQVIITHPSNDPALFSAQIRALNKLENGINVLFEGELLHMRNEYAKQILADLVHEGLEGEELIETFDIYLRQRKNARSDKTS
ncbi:YwpF family protein [Bacillus sp. B190/17]|uniref:YwpF family protein n=1 Tax=Bacillus lumedeiriae TaxID=3058829 RepID=A0ABW8I7W8_9BACI